jgi:hypothetical protein
MIYYTHQPLNHPESQIRLLQLHPGRGKIQCSLLTVDLNSSLRPGYEPISYCWGSQKNPKFIYVEKFKFAVGRNLYAALKRLRYRDAIRILWCDSICIDQANIPEKNVQVPLMTKIYQNGLRTIAWLGENPLDKQVFPMFEALAAFSNSEGATRNRHQGNRLWSLYEPYTELSNSKQTTKIASSHWHELTSKGHDDRRSFFRNTWIGNYVLFSLQWYQNRRARIAIERFFARPWFSRVWVIQEVAVSPKVIVVSGKRSIDWDIITTANSVSLSSWGLGFENLMAERKRHQAKDTSSLADMLSSTLNAEATDSRDRFYAVLGLLEHDESLAEIFMVDYTTNPLDLFEKLTRLSLQSTDDANRLLLGGGKEPMFSGVRLNQHPSWVWCPIRDQTQRKSYIPLWNLEGEFQASLNSNPNVVFSSDGKILKHTGYVLDVVSELGPAIEPWRRVMPTPSWSYDAIQTYLTWRRLARIDTVDQYPNSNITRKEAFYSLLPLSDRLKANEHKRILERSDVEHIDKFVMRFFTLFQNSDLRVFSRANIRIRSHMRLLRLLFFNFYAIFLIRNILNESSWHFHRRMMLSEQGYIGLVPRPARVGDRIVLIKGIRVPVVLRPCGEGWELVCEAYMVGAMDGELWDENKCYSILLK